MILVLSTVQREYCQINLTYLTTIYILFVLKHVILNRNFCIKLYDICFKIIIFEFGYDVHLKSKKLLFETTLIKS